MQIVYPQPIIDLFTAHFFDIGEMPLKKKGTMNDSKAKPVLLNIFGGSTKSVSKQP